MLVESSKGDEERVVVVGVPEYKYGWRKAKSL